MQSFNRINDILGWIIFGIAATTYLLTMEETASFWDCGEFIAVSYKLEVPHPPGAPFFLLLGRMFSFLASEPTEVAYWITSMSAFSSAFTILFLFWAITLLARRMMPAPHTLADKIAILGSGAVGALAYAFSDSFWFSAVEAEVYGMSSFFTALVVWAMLKWERIEDERAANRFLIFIAYMMGLSIGVHLLNLLTIPAMTLLYYYRQQKSQSTKGVLISLLVGFGIIVFINFGIIPGLPTLAGDFEVFFVNTFGLPFGSGLFIFMALLIGGLIYLLMFSLNPRSDIFGLIRLNAEQKALLNVAVLSTVFVLIGYSTYLLVIIRSNYNTPINENDPSDIISFVSYLKREQYGDRPLLYGPHFMSGAPVDYEDGAPKYRRNDELGKYEIYDYKTEYVYKSSDKMLLPRMYSTQPGHAQRYRNMTGLKPKEKPAFGDNLEFMFGHQLKHMYFRYFMWNFAGRATDEKEAEWLGPFEGGGELPEILERDKAHDNFYMLPLLLGILGLFFHYGRDHEGANFVMTLFIMLGVMIVMYINSPPVEPRERDYVYVGSFYAFAMWIGLGVMMLRQAFKMIGGVPAAALAVVLGLGVPALMGTKSWDNHDRSDRFFSVDQARNTLASCAPNAVLFTGGDNDTFPLWYVQEVEGFRTDVRVVVLSYFNTDWYISQMQRQVYESEPLPITFKYEQYRAGTNDVVRYYNTDPSEGQKDERVIDLKRYVEAVKKESPQVVLETRDGNKAAIFPSRNFALDVDSAKVAGIVPEELRGRIDDVLIQIDKNASYILKGDLMLLDIFANFNWERPIYFNTTSANTTSLDIKDYLFQEGMAYRFLPVRAQSRTGMGGVSVDVMLENLEKFQYRGMQNSNAYYDVEFKKFGSNFRSIYWRLSTELLQRGRKKEALQVLNDALANIPDSSVPYSYYAPRFVDAYLMLEEDERGLGIADTLLTRSEEMLEYLRDNDYDGEQTYQEYESQATYILNDLSLTFRRLDQLAEGRLAILEKQKAEGKGTGDTDGEISRLRKRQELFKKYFSKADSTFQRFR